MCMSGAIRAARSLSVQAKINAIGLIGVCATGDRNLITVNRRKIAKLFVEMKEI